MALEFCVISLKKDLNNRHYLAGIEFQGRERNYEIHTNASVRYLKSLPEKFRLSILDGFDCAFQKDNNGGIEELYFEVKGIDSGAQKCEKGLENAILKFIREECCEKT